MGSIHKFQRRPKQRPRTPAKVGHKRRPLPRGRSQGWRLATTIVLAIIFGTVAGFVWMQAETPVPEGAFGCMMPRIIDGDTFDCAGTRVRLQGIDAPETAGHCRPGRKCAPGDPTASTENLRQLVRWSKVICQKTDTDIYGRTVARCSAGKVDLSCAQVEGGYAILRYAPITC